MEGHLHALLVTLRVKQGALDGHVRKTEGNTNPKVILTRNTKPNVFEEPHTPYGDQK